MAEGRFSCKAKVIKPLKVFQLSHADGPGGAARAAYRIHKALRQSNVDSTMMVNIATSEDWTVVGPTSKMAKMMVYGRVELGGLVKKALRMNTPVIHSSAVLPSDWKRRLNRSEADVVQLHWVNREMLSISDIGRLRKPIVWTLHDMWAFCGTEHYTEEFRWREGYSRDNRPEYERGCDLNRWTWERKRRHWTRPMHIVTPSRWLARCVKESALMRNWPVTVIPYPIDTEMWRPIDKKIAREVLGLPCDEPLLLFGATGGGRDPRKGFDLLSAVLNQLREEGQNLRLVVFGECKPKSLPELGFPIHYIGHLYDEVSLRLVYSAADAFVLPSRQDNLPNTGLEAHACATPVVCFDVGGLPDIVAHKETGYIARTRDIDDMANGIAWVLKNEERLKKLSDAARQRALVEWSTSVVVNAYKTVYEQVLRA